MKELGIPSQIFQENEKSIATALQEVFLIIGKQMQEKLKEKIRDEDLKKFWSGELTVESLAELYGLEPDETRNFLLYETEVGKLLLRNIKEFREEIRKFVEGEIKQFPLLITAPIEQAMKVFHSYCDLFEESDSVSEKLLIGRELREYIKLIVGFYDSGIIEDKENKLQEMKKAHKEIFGE